jgi:hypothetical protein
LWSACDVPFRNPACYTFCQWFDPCAYNALRNLICCEMDGDSLSLLQTNFFLLKSIKLCFFGNHSVCHLYSVFLLSENIMYLGELSSYFQISKGHPNKIWGLSTRCLHSLIFFSNVNKLKDWLSQFSVCFLCRNKLRESRGIALQRKAKQFLRVWNCQAEWYLSRNNPLKTKIKMHYIQNLSSYSRESVVCFH